MEIIRAEILGFCFGVRRAVEIANKALDENKEKKVYSLGPLIHNEAALKSLEKKGLLIADENRVFEIEKESIVIIRAHGVSPFVINQLNEKECEILDATCPRVKNSQKMVEKYTKQKDFIIFSGDKNHGEVKSIEGYSDKNFVLLQNRAEAEFFANVAPKDKSILLMSQTTFSTDEFDAMSTVIKAKYSDVQIENTICPATKERQDALRKLCQQVEGVLVIGGKNSANTKRLFEIASENCISAAHIQCSEEIPIEFMKLGKIGLTAGASTPDEIIDDVEKKLQLR